MEDRVQRRQTLFLTALSLVEATAVAHNISLHTDHGRISAPMLYRI